MVQHPFGDAQSAASVHLFVSTAVCHRLGQRIAGGLDCALGTDLGQQEQIMLVPGADDRDGHTFYGRLTPHSK